MLSPGGGTQVTYAAHPIYIYEAASASISYVGVKLAASGTPSTPRGKP
jgi:hypothetical protein